MSEPNQSSWQGDEHFGRNVIIICLVATAYYLSYFRYGLAQIDEGVILDSAERMMKGDRFGIELFMHYGLLRAWLLSKVFIFTGVNFPAERIFFIAMRLPGLVLLYAVGRRIIPQGWAVGVTMVAVFVPGHLFKSTLLILIMFQIWLVFRWWENPGRFWAFAIGFWGAFSIWSRVETMFVMIPVGGLALLIGLWQKSSAAKEWKRHIIYFLLGVPVGVACLLPIFPGMAYFFVWTMRFMMLWYKSDIHFSTPWPMPSNLFMGLDRAATFVFFWAGVLTYVIALIDLLVKLKNSKGGALNYYRGMIALIGLSMFYNVFAQSNLGHLVQVCAPVYLLFGDFFSRALKVSHRLMVKILVSIGFGSLILFYLVYGVILTDSPGIGSFSLRKMCQAPINSRLGTVYFTEPTSSEIQGVVDYLVEHTDPGDPVIGYPGCLIVQVMAGRPNATMVTFFLPGTALFLSPHLPAEIRKQTLDAKYIVYFERSTHLEALRQPKMRTINAPMGVYEVMAGNFTIEHRIGRYLILRRGADKTGATPVFLEGLEAYKYRQNELALEKFKKALEMGGLPEIINPLLIEVGQRINN